MLYTTYLAITQRAADLNNAAALLQWDQETYMPAGSGGSRARQLSTLAAQAHEWLTAPEYGDLLRRLSEDASLDDEQAANIRISREDFEKNSRLPTEFVARLSEATSRGFEAWHRARSGNDFAAFLPDLENIIALKKEQANRQGYEGGHPYNALLDEYERGATVSMLDGVFAQVKAELPPLLARILEGQQGDDGFFSQHFPKEIQWAFSQEALTAMGYDWARGRQDYSAHPFSTSFGPDDVRITTRVDEQDFSSLFWSSAHECGHALYEQGLPMEQYGLPLGRAASLAIHESQSRLWENGIARSRPFWDHCYPALQERFPQQLGNVSAEQFYRGMNKVQPSLIRTEADEVTYHFHVLIRYELEKQIITGGIAPKDLPEAWNAMYRQHLGIRPGSDANGVLQDVHWSHGSFGYFPTYSLGSFYAAQFLEQAATDVPGCDRPAADGTYKPLLAWLRGHIHRHGARYRSEELCKRITGRALDIGVFLRYLHGKYLNG